MTITTEKAEECARGQDAIKESSQLPGYRSIAERAGATIRSLAAERDALQKRCEEAERERDALRRDASQEIATSPNAGAKAMNTWPDPARPGVPPQDGVYWLQHKAVGDKQPCLYEKGRWYCCGSDIGLSPMRCAARYSYLSPCLTPDEVQNLRDDLASAERERAHQHGRADHNAAEHAREQGKREALQKRVAVLEGALGDLLRCTEKHVFGDECKAQRDKARAALEGGKNE